MREQAKAAAAREAQADNREDAEGERVADKGRSGKVEEKHPKKPGVMDNFRTREKERAERIAKLVEARKERVPKPRPVVKEKKVGV